MSLKRYQPAVFDSQPPDVYGSVTEAQRNNNNHFLPTQKEGITGSPVSGTTGTYMALHDQDRENCNEYDYIPGENLPKPGSAATTKPQLPLEHNPGQLGLAPGQVSMDGAGEGSCVRGRETKNVLYEDHEIQEQLIHPTLPRQDKKKGVVQGGEGGEGGEKVGVVGGRKATCSTGTLFMTFFITLAILLAISSLGLSIMVWFNVNDSSSSSSTDPSTDTSSEDSAALTVEECDCPDGVEEDIALLREDVDMLLAQLNSSTSESGSLYHNLSIKVDELMNRTDDLRADMNHVLDTQSQLYNQTITNISGIFTDCDSRVLTSCDMPSNRCDSPEKDCNCSTELVNITTEVGIVISATCRLTILDSDLNTIVASLERRDDELLQCVCTRIGEYRAGEVECELVVLTCPLFWDLGTYSIIDRV